MRVVWGTKEKEIVEAREWEWEGDIHEKGTVSRERRWERGDGRVERGKRTDRDVITSS